METAEPEPAGSGEPGRERVARLARAIDRRQRASWLAGADPLVVLGIAGSVILTIGFALILIGWSGVAHSLYLQQELAYVVSGGLLGLALVFVGCTCYSGYLSSRQTARFERAVRDLHQALSSRLDVAPTTQPQPEQPGGPGNGSVRRRSASPKRSRPA